MFLAAWLAVCCFTCNGLNAAAKTQIYEHTLMQVNNYLFCVGTGRYY